MNENKKELFYVVLYTIENRLDVVHVWADNYNEVEKIVEHWVKNYRYGSKILEIDLVVGTLNKAYEDDLNLMSNYSKRRLYERK